jgi:DNA polymerase (family 10)
MKNQELAKLFYEIADFLEMENVPFKPAAYRKAGLALENLSVDVEQLYKEGGEKAVEKIPGVGKGIASKIIEFLKTGKIKYYLDYKKKYPLEIGELTSVEGLGPKMIRDLYRYLKIKNLKDLEKAAKTGKIRTLPNFGEKTEKNILQGIEFLKKSAGRFLLGEILPAVKRIEGRLKSLKDVQKISVCGSVRRRKETIGDVDFLVVTKNPERVMDFFCSLEGVVKVWGKGRTKSSIRLKEGFDVDLRVVAEESYGSALQYFTGSKEHNIVLRRLALEKGLKLNEYGIFKGKKRVGGWKEEEIYSILGMDCPAPELRENRGEIEAALKKELPCLVELHDIKGDLHTQTKWNGGENTIEEMVEAALKMNYQYLGISDHTKFLKIEHGLDERQLALQRKEIDKMNSSFSSKKLRFRLLQGAETNILKDGSIDIKEEALKKLDYAIGGVHSHFKMPKKEMTERIIKAMKNPYINIISHPTGRILKRRDEYQIDIGKILRAARETKTVLEINAYPERLDLNDLNIRDAIKEGVKLVINTDAHHRDHLRFMEYGVYQARRGWAEPENIINAYPLEKLIKVFSLKRGKK